MEFSVVVMDAWNVRHAKPFSGRVIGVDSVKEAAEKWVHRFYDRSLKVESATVKSSCRSANVSMVTVNCEGGKVFFFIHFLITEFLCSDVVASIVAYWMYVLSDE